MRGALDGLPRVAPDDLIERPLRKADPDGPSHLGTMPFREPAQRHQCDIRLADPLCLIDRTEGQEGENRRLVDPIDQQGQELLGGRVETGIRRHHILCGDRW